MTIEFEPHEELPQSDDASDAESSPYTRSLTLIATLHPALITAAIRR